MVVDLESPERGYGDSVERGGNSPGGNRFDDRIEQTETISSGTLSSRTFSRSGGPIDGIKSRIEPFEVAKGPAATRRNSM